MAHNIKYLIVTLINFTCLDREFNSTPFDSLRNLNMTLVCAIIGVPISYNSSHLRFNKTVKSNSIVSTCNIYINSTC